MKYLLNIGSRTIHKAYSTDGRCKLKEIASENKKVFETKEEAMTFLPVGRKPVKFCSFCCPDEKIQIGGLI